MVHIGSWGTPDFGITEAIGNLIGAPQTAQGGSNLSNQPSTPQGQLYTPAPIRSPGGGSALGASTGPSGGGFTAPSGGGGSPAPTGGQSITEQQAVQMGLDWNNLPSGYSRAGSSGGGVDAAAEAARNAINAGYDSYFSQLDQMLGSIPGQRQGQEQIVQNNFNQGLSDIEAQKASSMGDLATQRRKTGEGQVKSLADIADNIRNLFQTGNVMLGTRGAGDSSAANMYSYAVSKLGSKQRGDVMAQSRSIENDIQDRESKLNNIVTQETAKLKTNRDNTIIQVAQYFQDAQNQLLQAKAQGQLQKGQSLRDLSTQILQQAQQQLMLADQDFRNRQNSLLSWAESNSRNIAELRSNLAGIGQYNAPGLTTQRISGTPTIDAQGNMNAPLTYGGGVSRSERDQYGNLIR